MQACATTTQQRCYSWSLPPIARPPDCPQQLNGSAVMRVQLLKHSVTAVQPRLAGSPQIVCAHQSPPPLLSGMRAAINRQQAKEQTCVLKISTLSCARLGKDICFRLL